MNNFSVEFFVELLAGIAEQTVSQDLVIDWLSRAIEKVETDYGFVRAECEKTEYDLESPDEIDLGLSALENYRESLGLLEDYLECGETGLLNEAAELAIEVNQLFVAAADENQRVQNEVEIDLCF